MKTKRVTALILALIMATSLVGCGGSSADGADGESGTEQSSQTAPKEAAPTDVNMADQEFNGVTYQMPETWNVQNNGTNYTYSPEGLFDLKTANELVMVQYSDISEMTKDNAGEKVNAFAETAKDLASVSDFSSENCEVSGIDAVKATYTQAINTQEFKNITYFIPVGTKGVIYFVFASNGNATMDYQPQYDKVLESITMPDFETLEALQALEGKPLVDAMKKIKKLGYTASYLAEGEDFTEFIDDLKEDYTVEEIKADDTSKTVEVNIILTSKLKAREAEEKLKEKLDPAAAWSAVKQYGKLQCPYGFKLHTLTGRIAQEMEDEDTWFLKAKCDITNEYGAKGTFVCEAKVTGTTAAPEVVFFDVY